MNERLQAYEKAVRQTRRTTTALRAAIEMARSGKQILYVTHSIMAIQHFIKNIINNDMASEYLIDNNSMIWKNKGALKFVSKDYLSEHMVGKSYFRIFEDNAIIDIEVAECIRNSQPTKCPHCNKEIK
jgi:hypothetical protein